MALLELKSTSNGGKTMLCLQCPYDMDDIYGDHNLGIASVNHPQTSQSGRCLPIPNFRNIFSKQIGLNGLANPEYAENNRRKP